MKPQAPHSASMAMKRPVTRPILASRSTAIQAFLVSKRSGGQLPDHDGQSLLAGIPGLVGPSMGMSTARAAIWAMEPSNM